VDFWLSADEQALQEGVRRLCAGRFPVGGLRALEGGPGVDREKWGELAAAGVFDLRLAPGAGGAGLGMAEAVLVFEELGRGLVPGPLVASHLAAGVIEGAATGSMVVGAVEAPAPAGPSPTPSPVPVLVDYLDALDRLVVVGFGELTVFDAALVRSRARPISRPLDPLTPLHALGPDALSEGGERLDVPADVWRREGAALAAALALGLAEATTEAAVAYAKQRRQFDRPIGGFQAVKHILAEMLVRTEVARAAVYAAGTTLDDPTVGDADRAVSVAKLVAVEAALANGKACIQVHGGMGFTWEVDAHLYLKRAWVLDTVWGSADAHAEALAGPALAGGDRGRQPH